METKTAGRPPKYKSVDELESAIEDYFEANPEKPTQTGLAIYLGFESRQSLFDYKAKDEFSYTIKKAFTRIDNEHEKRLYESSNSGSIFYLKNRGWSDSLDVTSGGEKIVGSPIIASNPEGEKPDEL